VWLVASIIVMALIILIAMIIMMVISVTLVRGREAIFLVVSIWRSSMGMDNRTNVVSALVLLLFMLVVSGEQLVDKHLLVPLLVSQVLNCLLQGFEGEQTKCVQVEGKLNVLFHLRGLVRSNLIHDRCTNQIVFVVLYQVMCKIGLLAHV
jgi:hypothetical protein